jgi:hypothetical protein
MEKEEDGPTEGLVVTGKTKNLGFGLADLVASIMRVGVGLGAMYFPPIAALAEGASYIRGQRLERIEKFVRALAERLQVIESDQEVVKTRLTAPEGSDLLDDGFLIAARTLDDEKRQAVAELLARSLSEKELKYAQAKKLMSILDELEAPELIFLRHFAEDLGAGHTSAFYDQHAGLLEPVPNAVGLPEEVEDWGAIQQSYRAHLQRLGLVQPRDDTSVTHLGRMLLRFIGVTED